MAIIYSYPLNDNIKPLDELVGTTEKIINGQLKTVTRNFLLQDLAEFFIVDGGLQKTITLTTNDTSGAATLDQITGVLNIPQYSGGSTITPSPLTRVNDTNITLTLGGTPNTSLLQSVSLTLGWTGTLADSRIASASTWNAKENSSNKQNSLALDGTGTKFPTVDAVNLGITNSNYWTKTDNDIVNTNSGNVGIGTTTAPIGNTRLVVKGTGAGNTTFSIKALNSGGGQVFSLDDQGNINNSSAITTSREFGSTRGYKVTNGTGLYNGFAPYSGYLLYNTTFWQSDIKLKYASDLSASYDDRTLVDKGYVTTSLSTKENSLGNPSTNGYVLSSTTAGVRSWVAQTGGGGSQDLQSVTDIDATTDNTITINTVNKNGLNINASGGDSAKSAMVLTSTLPDGTAFKCYSYNGSVANYFYADAGDCISLQTDYASGVGLSISSAGAGITAYSINLPVVELYQALTNKGIVINSGTSSTGNFIELNKSGVDKFTINQQGEQSIVKIPGGTSSQFLKANGTVDSSVYTTAQNLQSVTNLGATTTNTIIANVASSNPANPAITGYSTSGAGVYGQSDGKGVYGYSLLDIGVYGFAESVTGIGVKGYAEDGVGGEFETDANSLLTNIVNFKKSGVLKASVGNGGDITAASFIKQGGSPTQFLMSDGSVTIGNGGVYSYEIHVSQVDGNDTTGTGAVLNPVASITKALTLITGQRKTIIIHPGNYTESPSITSQYTVLTTYQATGGNTLITGTVSTNTGCSISGLKMTNLTINGVTGRGNINILNCDISGTFTKNGTADYTLIRFCDIGVVTIVSSAGVLAVLGGNLSFITVNSAGASILVKNAVCISPAVLIGSATFADCILISTGPTTNALTTSAGTNIVLANSQCVIPTFQGVARVSLSGFYSILNCVFDKPNSTLVALSGTGGSTNSIVYSQFINADKFIKQGGTPAQLLAANGDSITAGTNITISGGTISATGGGAVDDLDYLLVTSFRTLYNY